MTRNRRRGFTLIELMIVVAISGMLVAGLLPLLPRYLRQVVLMNRAQAEVSLSAQTTLQLLGNDVRSAAALEGEWRSFKGGERCLILRLPAEAAEPDRIVYYADPKNPGLLVKQVFTAPGSRRRAARQVLARNLRRLSFTTSAATSGGKVVSYELSFASEYDRHVVRETFRGAAGLRNGG